MTALTRTVSVVSLAVAFAVGAVFVAYAEDTPTSLEERVASLEALVEDLQDDLADANERIEELEGKVADLKSSSSDDDDDDSKNKGKRVKIEGDGSGSIKVCHNGNTIHVNIVSLKAHLAHVDLFGDAVGECGHEYRWNKSHSDDDDDEDDDDEDEDEDDDDDDDDEDEDDD